VRIGCIAVDTRLDELDVDPSGAVQAPKDFARAGWYAKGNRPGDVGPAIIAGHVDSKKGPAVFKRLDELRAGGSVEVLRGETWMTFRVLATRHYPKTKFPTDEGYAPTPNAQLRLITCGGAFDHSRGSYLDNIVVYAVLV
jgi:sortase (surface protein transpeptidase)